MQWFKQANAPPTGTGKDGTADGVSSTWGRAATWLDVGELHHCKPAPGI